MLKDEFRNAGSVRRADVKTDRDGRSSGCAVVYFETHRGASNAIGESCAFVYTSANIILCRNITN